MCGNDPHNETFVYTVPFENDKKKQKVSERSRQKIDKENCQAREFSAPKQVTVPLSDHLEAWG